MAYDVKLEERMREGGDEGGPSQIGQGFRGNVTGQAGEEKEMRVNSLGGGLMKKGILVWVGMFLGINALALADAGKGTAKKGSGQSQGMSVEDQAQKVMMESSSRNDKDLKDSMSDMKKTNEQKAQQRKAVANQKAAQAKTKEALKAKFGKAPGKAPANATPVTLKK